MPQYTTNLNLFKYNTATDGKEVFSITQALNHNWDIIDNFGDVVNQQIQDWADNFVQIECVIEKDTSQTWYRKWSDGFCEQGGIFGDSYTSYQDKTITFPISFKDNKYFSTCHCAHTGDLYYPSIKGKTASSITYWYTYNNGGYGCWYACGYVE